MATSAENRKTAFALRVDTDIPLLEIDSNFWDAVTLDLGCTPNTGFMAILVLLRHTVKKLSLGGFDFYTEGNEPKLCHHNAYLRWGGDDVKKKPKKSHKQDPQIRFLREHVLPRKDVFLEPKVRKVLMKSSDVIGQQSNYRLTEYLKGKRVVLVGPSPHLKGQKLGKVIDGYDVVCRVNEVSPFGLEEDYGSRTDIIFHACHKDGVGNFITSLKKMGSKLKDTEFLIAPQRTADPYVKEGRYKKALSGVGCSIKFLSMDDWFWNLCSEQVGTHPNTGILAMLLLARSALKELFITGFSFYVQGWKPEERHHKAYIEYGGDAPTNRVEISSGHPQHQQRWWFRNKFLSANKDLVKVDSYLDCMLRLQHHNVHPLKGYKMPKNVYDCPGYFIMVDGMASYEVGQLRYGDALCAMGYALGIDSFAKMQLLYAFTKEGKGQLPKINALDQMQKLAASSRRCPTGILDVGAGRGEVGLALAHIGYNVQSVEPSSLFPELIKDTQAHYGFTNKTITINTDLVGAMDKIDWETLDTILFVESLEHITEADFNLVYPKILATLKKNKGRLIIVNWIDYHPIAVGRYAPAVEHCREMNDELYDTLAKDAKTTVFRKGSHLVLDY